MGPVDQEVSKHFSAKKTGITEVLRTADSLPMLAAYFYAQLIPNFGWTNASFFPLALIKTAAAADCQVRCGLACMDGEGVNKVLSRGIGSLLSTPTTLFITHFPRNSSPTC